MDFYNNKKIQTAIVLLYPIVMFLILSFGRQLGFWLYPILTSFLFSLLLGNLRLLFLASTLMWGISVPLWWLLVQRPLGGQGAAIFIDSLPFVILAYIGVMLLPQIFIIVIRNFLIKKLIRP